MCTPHSNGFIVCSVGLFRTSRALISQDYWGDIKEDWGSGGHKSPSGSRGGALVEGLGDFVPQKLKLFL